MDPKIENAKVDRGAFKAFSSFEEAEADDRVYWLSSTPQERVRHIEFLRRLNYGSRATERLQRVLETTTRSRC